MFTVNLYSFSKKENSTAVPAGSGTSFRCVLKHDSSIIAPVITLDIGTDTAPDYNYAFIPAYGRYYFIDEWSWTENRLWSASMSVDALATYRDVIGSTPLYILRASNAYDGDIIDNTYPAKTNSTYQNVYGTDPFTENPADGVFVIGVAGSYIPTHGSLAYYAVDQSNMINMMMDLNDNFVTTTEGFNEDDASFKLQKALIDPFSYIKSCVWFPVSYGTLPIGEYELVNLGGVELPHTGGNLIYSNRAFFSGSIVIGMPQHPDAGNRGNYMNAVYRRITALIPPFGTFEVDPSVACNYSNLFCNYSVDVTSGIGVADIGCGYGSLDHLLTRVETRVGVPIQLNAVFRDYFNAGASAVGGLIGAAFGSVSGLFSGVTSAINAMRPIPQSMGSSGSYASFYGVPTLFCQFMHLVDENNYRLGRPLCRTYTPSALGGYMECQNADVDITGTLQEHTIIKNYLEMGFYYE